MLTIKERLQTIVDKVLSQDVQWLEEQDIEPLHKSGYCVLNYGFTGKVNEYNVLTRGLVIDETDGRIVCFPFERFFNLGEKNTVVNLAECEVLEKLDGTLLSAVFLPDGSLFWSTRRMISAHQVDMNVSMTNFDGSQMLLMQELGTHLATLKLDPCWKGTLTLSFEAIVTNRPVVTCYADTKLGLYLINARNMQTYEELSEEKLDDIAVSIGARRPRRHSCADTDAVNTLLAAYPDDYEGFVVRERGTNVRAKIKKESYLRRHRLLGQLNYKTLLPLYLAGERHEIETYFPEARSYFDIIASSVETYIKTIHDAYVHMKVNNMMSDRKEYALYVLRFYKDISSHLFNMLKAPADADISKYIHQLLQNTKPENVLEALALVDSENTDDKKSLIE